MSAVGRRRCRQTKRVDPSLNGPAVPCRPIKTARFPCDFTVPEAPGTLLRFPAVQRCLNGDKLNWTADSIESPYPAPRVLILPAGYEPAKTINEVPLDAPGRTQLTDLSDTDNPTLATTTTVSAPTTTVQVVTTTRATTTAATPSTQATRPADHANEPDDGNGPWVAALAGVVVAAEAAIIFGKRRRRKAASRDA